MGHVENNEASQTYYIRDIYSNLVCFALDWPFFWIGGSETFKTIPYMTMFFLSLQIYCKQCVTSVTLLAWRQRLHYFFNGPQVWPSFQRICQFSTLIYAILSGQLWPPSGKMKLGHQSGCAFFMFHDHFVTLWLQYLHHDPYINTNDMCKLPISCSEKYSRYLYQLIHNLSTHFV